MHHLEGPLLGLEALFSLPFLSSCTYLSVKCLWLLHCWSSAAVRQWELSSARGPRNTLRIQQGGQEIATPHRLSFPFGRPDPANVPYLCQQRAGDLRFCHSRRWFGTQAGQTPPHQPPFAPGTGQAGVQLLLASLRALRPPPTAPEAFISLASYYQQVKPSF